MAGFLAQVNDVRDYITRLIRERQDSDGATPESLP